VEHSTQQKENVVTIAQHTDAAVLPDDIARRIVLPEGHADLPALFDAYKWARNNMPLAKAFVEGYEPLWLVTKHADIQEIENLPEFFCAGGGAESPGSHNPILTNQAGDEFTKSINNGSLKIMELLPYLDPPEHTEASRGVFSAVRPAMLGKYEAGIRDLARESIAHLVELSATGDPVDVVDDFALAYPLRAVMELVGIPQQEYPRMLKLTQELFGAADPEFQREDVEVLTPEAAAQQWANTVKDYYAYFDTLVEECRANPREDLATLIACEKSPDGEYLPKEICYARYIEFATAGHDTTSGVMAGMIWVLAQRPDILARIKADTSLVPKFVNESVRFVSPVKHFMRRALSDYTIRGQTIKSGDRLMMLFQSGNRDEEVFDHPDEFDVDRKRNPHVGFGFGTHTCPGRHIALLELRVLLEELLPRLESITLSGPATFKASNFIGGLKHLPASFTFSE